VERRRLLMAERVVERYDPSTEAVTSRP
jgi:hypothetical protein